MRHGLRIGDDFENFIFGKMLVEMRIGFQLRFPFAHSGNPVERGRKEPVHIPYLPPHTVFDEPASRFSYMHYYDVVYNIIEALFLSERCGHNSGVSNMKPIILSVMVQLALDSINVKLH